MQDDALSRGNHWIARVARGSRAIFCFTLAAMAADCHEFLAASYQHLPRNGVRGSPDKYREVGFSSAMFSAEPPRCRKRRPTPSRSSRRGRGSRYDEAVLPLFRAPRRRATAVTSTVSGRRPHRSRLPPPELQERLINWRFVDAQLPAPSFPCAVVGV